MSSFRRTVLVVVAAGWCWLMMQAVHEAGHVLAALVSGGRVSKVVLHPLAISRTDVEPNPHPQIVVWTGPLFGAIAPLLLWIIVRRFASPAVDWLLRVFAGFCLIANGGYLTTSLWDPAGDSAELLRLGHPVSVVSVAGFAGVAVGLWMWHGLGPAFGMRKLPSDAGDRLAWFLAVSTVALAVLEAVTSPRL